MRIRHGPFKKLTMILPDWFKTTCLVDLKVSKDPLTDPEWSRTCAVKDYKIFGFSRIIFTVLIVRERKEFKILLLTDKSPLIEVICALALKFQEMGSVADCLTQWSDTVQCYTTSQNLENTQLYRHKLDAKWSLIPMLSDT